MAEMKNAENVSVIRTLIDAYGVGVRAGVLTPCLQDENSFRAMIGLDAAPQEVITQWESTKGIRMPITLQKNLAEAQEVKGKQSDGGDNNGQQ